MKLFAALFLTVFLCSVGFSQAALRVGSPAPDFSARDINGEELALSELRGKVVVMTFWSTRCPICHAEFPKLNQMARSFSGKNVVFLSLTTEGDDIVESYLRKNQLAARVVPNSFGVLLQYADRDRNGNTNMGFPAYFVVDPQGSIQHRSSGYDKVGPIGSTLTRLLSSM